MTSISNPNTAPPQIQEEWRPVTLASIKNKEQVIAALADAIAGKHGPLKNKSVSLRIKPHSEIAVDREGISVKSRVRDDGWDVDKDVIESITLAEIAGAVEGNRSQWKAQLECPIAFVSFQKVMVDQKVEEGLADGFWFQLKDLEWKLI